MFVKQELDTNRNEVISEIELMEYFGVVDDVNPDDESQAADSDVEAEAEDMDPCVVAAWSFVYFFLFCSCPPAPTHTHGMQFDAVV
mgnify:CR=1 FL=1